MRKGKQVKGKDKVNKEAALRKKPADKEPEGSTKEENTTLKEQFHYLTEYEGRTYYLSKQKVNWVSAKQMCIAYGGHLVTITSSKENRAIVNALKAYELDHQIWIGYTDEKTEGKWEWITGEKSAFKNWQLGEPNNFEQKEDHVILTTRLSQFVKVKYRWYDWGGEDLMYFILEME
jgi:hypothetical protein